MSATAATPGVVNPKWKQLLRESIDKNMKENKDSISYAFSTLEPASPDFKNGAPRVRFVVHRGFVNERRPKEDRSWSSNDAGDDLPEEFGGWSNANIMTTTDVRGPKSQQIQSTKEVGSPIEIAWWFEPTGEQYRIRGHAFILPPPSHPSHSSFPSSRLSPPSSLSSQPQPNSGKPFDWESERVRTYRKLSPPLRASFARPIPGTRLDESGVKDTKELLQTLPNDTEAETEEDKNNIKKALENFALIVIEPISVDLCKLKDEPNKRYVYTKKDDGTWDEVEVIP